MASVRTFAAAGAPLLLAVASCAEFVRRQLPPPPAPVRSALHCSQGLPLIAVHAPGDHTAWFVIDTGAGQFTFVDPGFGRQIGLKCDVVRDPAIPFVYLSAVVPFLEVEGFGRRDLTVYVTEVSERSTFAGLDVKVQGALGTGYFRGQCLHLDWGRGEFSANELRQRLARHVPLPLRFGGNGELFCTVRVNGFPCEALIDTASPQSLVTQEFADRAKLEIDRKVPLAQLDTSLGVVPVRDGKIGCLGLGSEEVRDLAVFVVERRMPHANMLLGTDVLSRYGVLLDLSDAPYLVLDPGDGGLKSGEAAEPPPASPVDKPATRTPPTSSEKSKDH